MVTLIPIKLQLWWRWIQHKVSITNYDSNQQTPWKHQGFHGNYCSAQGASWMRLNEQLKQQNGCLPQGVAIYTSKCLWHEVGCVIVGFKSFLVCLIYRQNYSIERTNWLLFWLHSCCRQEEAVVTSGSLCRCLARLWEILQKFKVQFRWHGKYIPQGITTTAFQSSIGSEFRR